MKQYRFFGTEQANTTNNTIANAIHEELKRRYNFNLGTTGEEFKPSFPFFNFEFEEKPSTYKMFKHLFGGKRITNPLLYAKQLIMDSTPKEKTFDDAMEQLQIIADNIRKTKKVDEYDFQIDGIPVKIYQKFIQIGYTIIPFDNYDNYLDSLKSEKQKETVFNLVVNITNNISTTIAA